MARCGPPSTGAYWREQAWYYDLTRGWDGSFRYQGSPVGEEEHDKYTHWDNTGTYLLTYALPMKSLYITSKKPSVLPTLTASESEKVINAGRDYFSRRSELSGREMDRYCYEHRSKKELLAGLSSWSPSVRKRSAWELGRRDGDVMPMLLNLLKSSNLYSRYGAVEALGSLSSKINEAARVSVLLNALQADDLWLRILAAEALPGIGDPAKIAVPDMLKRPAMRNPEKDPRGMEHRYLAFALFNRCGGLVGRSLKGVNRELLMQAVRVGLQNQDGRARGSFASVYQAIAEKAPSGIKFASEIRMSGLELFAKHKINEGIGLLVDYAINQKAHASEKRIVKVMETLKSYGTHGRRILPQLRAAAIHFDQGEKNYPHHLSQGKAKLVRETIKTIETSTYNPALISLNR